MSEATPTSEPTNSSAIHQLHDLIAQAHKAHKERRVKEKRAAKVLSAHDIAPLTSDGSSIAIEDSSPPPSPIKNPLSPADPSSAPSTPPPASNTTSEQPSAKPPIPPLSLPSSTAALLPPRPVWHALIVATQRMDNRTFYVMSVSRLSSGQPITPPGNEKVASRAFVRVNATWTLFKQYKDFVDLHTHLQRGSSGPNSQRMPEERLPPLTTRHPFDELIFDPIFVEKQRKSLQKYLSDLIAVVDPNDSRAVRAFLDPLATVDTLWQFLTNPDKTDTLIQVASREGDAPRRVYAMLKDGFLFLFSGATPPPRGTLPLAVVLLEGATVSADRTTAMLQFSSSEADQSAVGFCVSGVTVSPAAAGDAPVTWSYRRRETHWLFVEKPPAQDKWVSALRKSVHTFAKLNPFVWGRGMAIERITRMVSGADHVTAQSSRRGSGQNAAGGVHSGDTNALPPTRNSVFSAIPPPPDDTASASQSGASANSSPPAGRWVGVAATCGKRQSATLPPTAKRGSSESELSFEGSNSDVGDAEVDLDGADADGAEDDMATDGRPKVVVGSARGGTNAVGMGPAVSTGGQSAEETTKRHRGSDEDIIFEVTAQERLNSIEEKSGNLVKQGGFHKNWLKRWFVLRKDGFLHYYKHPKDTNPCGVIPLEGSTVTPLPPGATSREYVFVISTKKPRDFYIQAESEAVRQEWLSAISTVIELLSLVKIERSNSQRNLLVSGMRPVLTRVESIAELGLQMKGKPAGPVAVATPTNEVRREHGTSVPSSNLKTQLEVMLQRQMQTAEDDNESTSTPPLPATPMRTVKAATLDRLVAHLFSPMCDVEFMSTFMLTYRSFTTPELLVPKLIVYFDMPATAEGEQSDRQATLIRKKRVISLLKKFVLTSSDLLPPASELMTESAPQHAIVKDILSFLARAESEGDKRLSSELEKLRSVVYRAAEEEDAWAVRKSLFDLGDPAMANVESTAREFLTVDEVEFAKQLTLLDFEVFAAINPHEFLNKNWSKPKTADTLAPGIRRMIRHFNRVSGWLSTLVVQQENVADRAAVITKLVKVGEQLRKFNNFSGVMYVIGALDATPIHRLKKTWPRVAKSTTKMMAEIKELVSPERSWKNLRTALTAAEPPCLPYVGVFLGDLTFIEDGNPDMLGPLINFAKRRHIYQTIQLVQHFQAVPYTFEPNPQMLAWIAPLPGLDEDDLHRLSLQREPREAPAVATE